MKASFKGTQLLAASPITALLLSGMLAISFTGRLVASQKAEQEGRGTSPTFEQALSWFPSDTENLTVARSFEVPRFLASSEVSGALASSLDSAFDFPETLRFLFFEGINSIIAIEPLLGHKIALALQGERNPEVVSSFGSVRREACSILVFEENLEDAWSALARNIRAQKPKVRSLVGIEVLQLPSTTVMESVYKPKEWQGLFIARIDANVLVIASSDRYLEELLHRRASKPKDRALPDTLPEWEHVDRSAPIYLVRHIPEEFSRKYFSGVTWSSTTEKLEFTFVGTRPGAEEAIRRLWEKFKISDSSVPASFHVEEDAVVLTVMTEKYKDDPSFYGPAIFLLIRVPVEDGTLLGS